MATRKFFVRGTDILDSTLPRDHVQFRLAGYTEASSKKDAEERAVAAAAEQEQALAGDDAPAGDGTADADAPAGDDADAPAGDDAEAPTGVKSTGSRSRASRSS